MNGMILSHIPLHESSMGRFKLNVHGHLHSNRVMKPTGFNNKTGEIVYSETEVDYRFHCVCVEQTDFAPILFEDVVKRIEEERETAGFTDARASILGSD
jgi:calcineurin-like phosphoesterase family protein